MFIDAQKQLKADDSSTTDGSNLSRIGESSVEGSNMETSVGISQQSQSDTGVERPRTLLVNPALRTNRRAFGNDLTDGVAGHNSYPASPSNPTNVLQTRGGSLNRGSFGKYICNVTTNWGYLRLMEQLLMSL
jgi:hypothetical protein